MAIRRNATPLGASERSPSAMKRKDAPQINPGTIRRSQPAVNQSIMAFSRELAKRPSNSRPHPDMLSR